VHRLITAAIVLTFSLLPAAPAVAAEANRTAEPSDPRGKIHIPIGIPDTLDTLKTFVEPEGCFSPGVGSYGVYFRVYDESSRRLVALTMDGVACAFRVRVANPGKASRKVSLYVALRPLGPAGRAHGLLRDLGLSCFRSFVSS